MVIITANNRTWSVADVEEIVGAPARRDGALLPILHDIQAAFGHVPAGAVPIIAEMLNVSRADVHGVVSFYHDFREQPADKPIIKLCRAEACQARGVDSLSPLIEQDSRVKVETVYCLGLCASGPSAMIGDRVFARLDAHAIGRLVEEAVG